MTTEESPMKRTGWTTLIAFIATIPIANAWLKHFGFWHVPGLGPVASGVVWVGLAFVLRDVAQLVLGRRWTWFAIALGTILSWWLASPALAVASGCAFAISETMDALIYTPLADRMFLRAVVISGWIGSLVDSAVFVKLAFRSYSGWWQLGLVKAIVVALATPVAYTVRRHLPRQRVVAA
jgi:uncharacterized PurR-regulated membrane protein YhhQ (DUF165 family)